METEVRQIGLALVRAGNVLARKSNGVSPKLFSLFPQTSVVFLAIKQLTITKIPWLHWGPQGFRNEHKRSVLQQG